MCGAPPEGVLGSCGGGVIRALKVHCKWHSVERGRGKRGSTYSSPALTDSWANGSLAAAVGTSPPPRELPPLLRLWLRRWEETVCEAGTAARPEKEIEAVSFPLLVNGRGDAVLMAPRETLELTPVACSRLGGCCCSREAEEGLSTRLPTTTSSIVLHEMSKTVRGWWAEGCGISRVSSQVVNARWQVVRP